MTKDDSFYYPDPEDEDMPYKIYKKREFQYHRIPERKKLETDEEIEKYRNEVCKGDFKPREQQAILANLFNPETPYNGALVMHGTGTGKTCSAIAIAEQFKSQAKKYNSKIYVLVPGGNTRENIKDQLLFCTGDEYLKNKELLEQLNSFEKERERKMAVYSALQNYRILSYKTFYRKVLGEKIVEKKIDKNNKITTSYRRNTQGEVERELVVDRISSMDNSVLIVDEAHNLTNNEYGEALKKIIKASENLKIILLTATPMKNLADDIVDLINFIRPHNKPMKREMIFNTPNKNYLLDFKEGGMEYLKKKTKGHVSFYRGSIPFTFAERKDKGEIPDGLLFTPVIKCNMEKFQLDSYNITTKNFDDSLNKTSSAASNFVFPGLDSTKKKIIGYYSTDGIFKVLQQLTTEKKLLLATINKQLFNGKLKENEENNFMYENENKGLSGIFLNLKYLRKFSVKFYETIKKLSRLVDGDKGAGTAFLYSNLVKAGGMEIFAEALKENGYLEYQENFKDYDIKDNTIDYRTGKTFAQMRKEGMLEKFRPATYLLITGGVDESGEDLPEIKQRIIRNVFNSSENATGKNIKFILGTKVMNEGVTLENIREIHILDVHYNLGKVDQVIGRGIRMCRHMDVITEENKHPKVNIYRYVSAIKNGLSTDEILYQKAELKYLLVKKVERALKEVAIDCPLLLYNNKFPEEIDKYKNCYYPTLENVKKGRKICPALCDFQSCDFRCDDDKLNQMYKTSTGYRPLNNKEVDYSTFSSKLASVEIQNLKNNIRDLFRFNHIYTFKQIYQYIIKSLSKHQRELFITDFLYQALIELMPKTENEFNNFTDTIYDKYNKPGYLIKKEDYFIFQPFDQNEDVPMYYRTKLDLNYYNQIPVQNYVSQKFGDVKNKDYDYDEEIKEESEKPKGYNFDEVLDYYLDREDNFIVGIIDKNTNKLASNKEDLFKIRPPRSRQLEKKRGTGIPTLKGAVCNTSNSKKELLKIVNKLPNVDKSDTKNLKTRESICEYMKKSLLELEKYSTSRGKYPKKNYIMIPKNHPIYTFPYNLEDRVKYNIELVKKIVDRELDFKTIKSKTEKPNYIIEIKDNKYLQQNKKKLNEIGFIYSQKAWKLKLE